MAMSFFAGSNAPGAPGHHAPGPGDEVKRRRRGKAPRERVPDPPATVMVHRMWLDITVIETRTMSHTAHLPTELPLRSWAPQPQLLWTYSAIKDYDILGLAVMALN